MEISKQEKLAIIDARLREIDQMAYNQIISKRIGDKTGDESISKHAVAALEKIEKQRDILAAMRREVEAEQ